MARRSHLPKPGALALVARGLEPALVGLVVVEEVVGELALAQEELVVVAEVVEVGLEEQRVPEEERIKF